MCVVDAAECGVVVFLVFVVLCVLVVLCGELYDLLLLVSEGLVFGFFGT